MRIKAAAVSFLLLTAGFAGAQDFEGQVESLKASVKAALPAPPLTKDQVRRALDITFLFENEKPYCLYDYVEDLDDGRSYTAGCIGFNVRSGTVRDVIERYSKRKPDNVLASYLPHIRIMEAIPEIDKATTKLLLPDFEAAWRAAAQDPLFREVQDEAVLEGFYGAVREADKLGIRTPLGRSIIYDTLIQHGGEDPPGSDPDSMPPMARKATAALGGGPAVVGEKRWLKSFLMERRKILANPNDPQTKGAWATSVDRVDTFLMLIKQDNMDLRGPLDLTDYFDGGIIP